jgi:tRNA 2-selenouridine synthase
MAVEKISIERFLELSQQHMVIDVRSPGEYNHAHIPGAYNIPLFDNEERKIVGTTYKQTGREAAIKTGLQFFGPKMNDIIEQTQQLLTAKPSSDNTVIVHCWRGGMRSAGIAWLLDLFGFKVYVLVGGYKSFRRWALTRFEKEYPLSIVGGYTGSGKTEILKDLHANGQAVIDLEDIAKHKGSAFGNIDGKEQPAQEMFENILALSLFQLSQRNPVTIWVEDESQRIGQINIPASFWNTMRKSPVYFFDIPFEERLQYIVQEYGIISKEKLVNSIIRIQKRLGGLDTKTAINHLLENNVRDCFSILLKYYDKHYLKALNKRENIQSLLHTIPCQKPCDKAAVRHLTDIQNQSQSIIQ